MSPPRTEPDADHEDDDARELLAPRAVGADSPGAAALGHLLEQSNREAAANRAQARDLIKALENVQRSQEYLGTALLDERRKSRWLVIAFVAGPLIAAACVWLVWSRVDDMRADYERMKAAWGGGPAFDRWFAAGANNAGIAASGLYNDRVPQFAALLASEGGDLPRFYARVKAGADFETVHKAIAAAVGAAPEEIAITRGATEALQLLIGGYNKLKPGDAAM